MRLRLEQYKSPCLTLLLVTDDSGALRALEFADVGQRLQRSLRTHYDDYELKSGAAPASITKSLEAYFDGDLAALDSICTATGGTSFQNAVWKALRSISPGTTASYGHIAGRVGRPTASRAVGAANGSNPIAIVVPCHRVIGASGALTGYGGGLARKRWLLRHEGVEIDQLERVLV